MNGSGRTTRSSVNRAFDRPPNSSAASSMPSDRADPSSGTSTWFGDQPRLQSMSSDFGRIRSSGTAARRTSASATLPIHARLIPPRPCVVITIRSTPISDAYAASAGTTAPSSSSTLGFTPACSMQRPATERRYSSSRARNAPSHFSSYVGRLSGYPDRAGASCTCTRCSRAPVRRAMSSATGSAFSLNVEPSSGTRMSRAM
jgi:hypothetical protein